MKTHAGVPDDRFKKLPLGVCFYTNANAAFNTRAANSLASDMATEIVVNYLATGKDQYVVNL